MRLADSLSRFGGRTERTDMEEDPKKEKHAWTEEFEVAGDQLVDRIRALIKEGSVRRIVIRNANGDFLMELPLSAGLAMGGVATIFSPILVALGAMASLIVNFKVEVVRKEGKDNEKNH
jgi:hypothetical protein